MAHVTEVLRSLQLPDLTPLVPSMYGLWTRQPKTEIKPAADCQRKAVPYVNTKK